MPDNNIQKGLIPGLKDAFGGADLMFLSGDPSGLIFPAQPTSDPSGAVIAYDSANDQFYRNESGTTWFKLGSVA